MGGGLDLQQAEAPTPAYDLSIALGNLPVLLYIIIKFSYQFWLVSRILAQLHQQEQPFQTGLVFLIGTQSCFGKWLLTVGIVVAFLYCENVSIAVPAEEDLIDPKGGYELFLFLGVLDGPLLLQQYGPVAGLGGLCWGY